MGMRRAPGVAVTHWIRFEQAGTEGFGALDPASGWIDVHAGELGIAIGLDPSTLRVRTLLNGRARQDYPVADMILPPARIVSLLSREMTPKPGDLIACGASVGVLPMRAGAVVEVAINGIGTPRNTAADQ